MKLATLCLFVLFLNTTAKAETIFCDNGRIEDIGDSYLSVLMNDEGVRVNPYEGSFLLPREVLSTTMNGLLFFVQDHEVIYSVEGTEEQRSVSLLGSYEPNYQTLTLSFNFEYQTGGTYFLFCQSLADEHIDPGHNY